MLVARVNVRYNTLPSISAAFLVRSNKLLAFLHKDEEKRVTIESS